VTLVTGIILNPTARRGVSILFFLAHGPLRARADMCVADGCAVGYCACLLFGCCMSALRFLCTGFVHVLSCANNLKEVCLPAPGYSMIYISNHMLATCRHVCIIWYDGGYRVHICTSHAQWNAKNKYEVLPRDFRAVVCCLAPSD
jgi:hypothetical protein